MKCTKRFLFINLHDYELIDIKTESKWIGDFKPFEDSIQVETRTITRIYRCKHCGNTKEDKEIIINTVYTHWR